MLTVADPENLFGDVWKEVAPSVDNTSKKKKKKNKRNALMHFYPLVLQHKN